MPAAASRLLLVLLAVAGSRQLSITEFAVPSTVEAGQNAELQCRYSEGERVDYVKWWWTPLYADSEDQNRVLLYQRLTGHPAEIPRRNVEGRENDTIVIMDLGSSDSGVYECEVSDVAEVRRHQELIVFSNGTGLKLNATRVDDGPDEDDEDDVLVECDAQDVTPQPELTLTVDGVPIDNITQYVNGGTDGLYDVFVNITLPLDDVDGKTIRCEVVYENSNVTHSYASELAYTSGAALSTTEAPEDATQSEIECELKDTNGVVCHRSSWMLFFGTIILAIVNKFYLMQY